MNWRATLGARSFYAVTHIPTGGWVLVVRRSRDAVLAPLVGHLLQRMGERHKCHRTGTASKRYGLEWSGDPILSILNYSKVN